MRRVEFGLSVYARPNPLSDSMQRGDFDTCNFTKRRKKKRKEDGKREKGREKEKEERGARHLSLCKQQLMGSTE